jgi:hypothetical protein
MLGRVDPFEALYETASFGSGEGLVKGRLGVGIQVVLHQRDALGVGKVDIGDVP